MDLAKILNQSPSLNYIPAMEQGKLFFSNLILQLEEDLSFLRTQNQMPQYSYFSKIRVLHGNLDENMKRVGPDAASEKAYLFLQLPYLPGFLIESEKDCDIYKIYKATKVNTILKSELGENTRPEIFVLKSNSLEEFKVLDDCFVRTETSDKTLSVKQMSEMLLLLAESMRQEQSLKLK